MRYFTLLPFLKRMALSSEIWAIFQVEPFGRFPQSTALYLAYADVDAAISLLCHPIRNRLQLFLSILSTVDIALPLSDGTRRTPSISSFALDLLCPNASMFQPMTWFFLDFPCRSIYKIYATLEKLPTVDFRIQKFAANKQKRAVIRHMQGKELNSNIYFCSFLNLLQVLLLSLNLIYVASDVWVCFYCHIK